LQKKPSGLNWSILRERAYRSSPPARAIEIMGNIDKFIDDNGGWPLV